MSSMQSFGALPSGTYEDFLIVQFRKTKSIDTAAAIAFGAHSRGASPEDALSGSESVALRALNDFSRTGRIARITPLRKPASDGIEISRFPMGQAFAAAAQPGLTRTATNEPV